MTEEIVWDQICEEEEVTEQEIKDAESSGRAPAGKYLVVVQESKPKQRNPKGKESYFVAGLKMKIEEVMALGGKAISGDEGSQHVGRFIFDDISLSKPGEADALRNRRIVIAKKAGIISESSSKIPSNTWSELIIGKRFLVTVEDNEYTPEGKTTPVKNTRVAMFGYDAPEAATKVSEEDLADI